MWFTAVVAVTVTAAALLYAALVRDWTGSTGSALSVIVPATSRARTPPVVPFHGRAVSVPYVLPEPYVTLLYCGTRITWNRCGAVPPAALTLV